MTTHHLPRLLITIALLFSASSLWAKSGGWMSDFTAAQQKAKKENKDLLINFTGSDWCGWCMKLKKEVFGQEVFQEKIPADFILVEIDFPRNKELPENIKKQNSTLREMFSISGFPTVVLCDADGRPYAKTGYQRGGADPYIAQLNELKKQKSQRDNAIAKAARLEGPAKARELERALSVVPRGSLGLYADTLAEIAQADPDDTSGFTAKHEAEQASKALRKLIHPLFKKREFAAVEGKVDSYIQESKPTGEALQTAMLYKLQALYIEKKYDEALKLAEEIIQINDTSKPARFSKMIKKRIGRLIRNKSQRGE